MPVRLLTCAGGGFFCAAAKYTKWKPSSKEETRHLFRTHPSWRVWWVGSHTQPCLRRPPSASGSITNRMAIVKVKSSGKQQKVAGACGIGVFATVRKHGFTIEVVRARRDPQHYFGLVLIE